MNFLYENNLPKDLLRSLGRQKKAKDQLQLGSQAMIHHLAIFNKLNWYIGSSFNQIKLRWSLENTENCTQGFVLLAPVKQSKTSCSNCLREKSQLFWSHCRQLSFSQFTASEKDNLRTESYSYKEQKLLQCTRKQNSVMKNEKKLWLLLPEQQKNDPE